MFAYTLHKEKFANEKSMKRANFKAAYNQIEAALNGDDSGPLDVSDHIVIVRHNYLTPNCE